MEIRQIDFEKTYVMAYEDEDGNIRIEIHPRCSPEGFAMLAADILREVAHFSKMPLDQLVQVFNEHLQKPDQTEYSTEGSAPWEH